MPAETDRSVAEHAELQRRTLRVLAAGQVIGAAALASAVTVGAFVVQGILGQETPWSGGATATVTIGTAFMSQALSRRMRRRGRRPGLQGGYGLAVVGALVAAVGAERSQLAVFLVGLFLYGSGQAANLLARYAATDLAAPEERSRAMSRIVFASTFGAVFGPLLIGPAERAGQVWFGLEKYTGPWLFSGVFFAAAFCNTLLFLRPDPLVVAGGLVTGAAGTSDRSQPRSLDVLRTVRSSPGAPLALGAMVVSQAVMIGVMAMTPVHMKLHGHETLSQYVVSTHIAGMYAFSPLVGRFSDRNGRLPAVLLGSVVLVAATVLAALSGDVEQLLFPALWLLGLGWNFGLIGGSSLLIDRVPAGERVAVQGTADLLMSFCGGLAGFSSGFVRRAVGYHALAGLATVAAGGLLAAAYLAYRSSRDGTGGREPRDDVAPGLATAG
jgi:MFS family permease